MLISFPFLRTPQPQTDDDRNDGTFGLGEKSGKGTFPVSHQFGWHGGVHLVAPGGDANPEPVRAIADGEVVFTRPCTPKPKQNPTERERDAYPLYYYAGWTSNGVVILKHKTEIGEGVEVVFYSIYQHLKAVANKSGTQVAWQKGDKVYRKDPIGQAGDIYGRPNRIHFEIVADKANVEKLMGRSTGKLQDAEGRRNCVWGDMHIVLPASTPMYAVNPLTETRNYVVREFDATLGKANDTLDSVAQRFHTTTERIKALNSPAAMKANWWPCVTGAEQAASKTCRPSLQQRTIRVPALYGAAAATPPDGLTAEAWALYTIRPVGQTNETLIITLSETRGTITLTTCATSGERRGSVNETEGAYKLYKTATDTYPGCPSAGYEMLRFGRILGPDAPTATDLHGGRLPHFRKIAVDANTVAFVDLNRAGVKVYSDADFPHWLGWTFIDDDTDGNSRCDSMQLLDLIEPMVPTPHPAPGLPSPPGEVARGATTVVDAATQYRGRLIRAYAKTQTGELRDRLTYCVVKMPTEWARSDFDKRWDWLRGAEGATPVSNIVFPMCLGDPAYERLKRHHQALAFWEDAVEEGLELKTEHYHFHPMRFIDVLKKCGWISEGELLRLLASAPLVGRQTALSLRTPMNHVMTKYMVNSTTLRKAHFLAQVGVETGWWQNREEIGNERYFRTMYELITPTEAGEDYDRAVTLQRNLPSGRRPVELPNPGPKPKPTINRQDYMATRPGQILKKAASMDNGAANASNGGVVGDGNRFRGRGFLQITGRRNYTSYGKYRSQNFTTDPNNNLLATNDYNACDASGFYWVRERVSMYSDRGNSSANVQQVGSTINLGNPNGTPLHNDLRLSAFNAMWSKSHDEL
ncbi:M23 family metallopeptidase [Burkholderia ubonensis]|uniref:M23 family metallopeptidase n=1 Tax=Burkholderia ubonensis TaxID=101571 RepID=UPI000F56AB34|nr:M23 family metallopeptidase [Burkholderia ubonensis]RQP28188.1 peptidase M23 [Burkholderia ubonensis]RQP30391.1 peptidase M23 [Burkholderia ubonensis]RQP32688.1 peptidase M23 [Burkholderia ubonensis]RQP48282.1 peptidase M23 [Burkholderia ubonensis]RQP51569.1 peptidase M23 [Burkholderia ubonensis]